MLSACWTVERRWATTKVVRFCIQVVQCLLHHLLALRVQGAGGLVQDQDRRVLEQGPGDADARNIQVMLQTEFELRQPVDPVGGSWYVETWLLNSVKKIWAEFQTVESKGSGIIAALKEAILKLK